MTSARRTQRSVAARSAFTLLELILVLVIVAILLSVSSVSLRELHATQTTRAAAEHLMQICQQARHRAINEARPHRLTIDLDQRAYWLSREEATGYEPLHTELGQRFSVDERFTLTCQGVPVRDGVVQLDFHPDGRSQAFRVTFATTSDRVTVTRAAMAERIRIE